MSEQTRQAVDDYLKAANKRPGEFLFKGRRGPNRNMTTRQYARLVSEWIGSVGLDPRLFGTHSLRRTKATLIYRRTGNLRAVQLLLGHTKIESTVRYLGIEVDDALARADTLCPSLYHRVTSHVPSGGNRSAILTGNHAGTFSSGCQHGSDNRELLT